MFGILKDPLFMIDSFDVMIYADYIVCLIDFMFVLYIEYYLYGYAKRNNKNK